MKRILLHVCCGPCATHSIRELEQESYEVTLFFSNSNIHPKEEYINRLNSLKSYADSVNVPLVVDNYNPEEWFKFIKGHEKAPEGGERCRICIKSRFEKTANYAKLNGFEWFTSTLTISPHKDEKMINLLGNQLSKEVSINFLPKNFKKMDGFKKSVIISKEHNLYRQSYCGCIFSARQNK